MEPANIGTAGWPAVAYEELPWENSYDPGTASRTQIRKHQGPYRAAIPAKIAGATQSEKPPWLTPTSPRVRKTSTMPRQPKCRMLGPTMAG